MTSQTDVLLSFKLFRRVRKIDLPISTKTCFVYLVSPLAPLSGESIVHPHIFPYPEHQMQSIGLSWGEKKKKKKTCAATRPCRNP